MKISAAEIVRNLNITGADGLQIIPPGSLVYISTDDPDGVCAHCFVKGKSCDQYSEPKPVGCPHVCTQSYLSIFCVCFSVLLIYLLLLCLY